MRNCYYAFIFVLIAVGAVCASDGGSAIDGANGGNRASVGTCAGNGYLKA